MFYKFVGGEENVLLDVFDKIILEGSLKFGSPYNFNDPFEFKFNSQAPSRSEFDNWHTIYAPEKTSDELENAWAAFSGVAKEWNTQNLPRYNLMNATYVLCLAQHFESHLMWAHYASEHRGFAVVYKRELITEIRQLSDHQDDNNVEYSDSIPLLCWFSSPPNEMVGKILFTKSHEWKYEKEYRIVMKGDVSEQTIYKKIDPSLISGIILGARASEKLIQRALDVRIKRPDFTVEQVSSNNKSYCIKASKVSVDRRTQRFVL